MPPRFDAVSVTFGPIWRVWPNQARRRRGDIGLPSPAWLGELSGGCLSGLGLSVRLGCRLPRFVWTRCTNVAREIGRVAAPE